MGREMIAAFPQSVVLSIMLAVTLASNAQAQIMPTASGIVRREQAGSFSIATGYTRAQTEYPGAAWPFEDRAFFYFDARDMHEGVRVTLDMYVRQGEMFDSTYAGSQLVVRAYSHTTAAVEASNWTEAERFPPSEGRVDATPDGWVHHVQIDVTEAARTTRGAGFLCIAFIAQGRVKWDTGSIAWLPAPRLLVDGTVATRSKSWGALKAMYRK